MTLPFSAVLWDMDGTLVDTEPYWIATEFEVVDAHGDGNWTDALAHAMVGMDLRDAARFMQEHGGVALAEGAIIEALLDGVVARVREAVPWRPGARELLAELGREGIPCALVTMSWHRFAQAILDNLPPEATFQAVVTGEDVTHGKPHPEPYLRGAALLGVSPQDCVALEDSPTGARSAQAAGCVVVAVPNVVSVPKTVCHHILPGLEGVRALDLAELHRTSQNDQRSPQ
jgi:HAD superfamily hydrolase (TIGR01509 family)